MAELSRQDAEALVAAIGIPPRPAVVITVQDEKARPEPDLMVIADAIARDVGISAALLKTINSALFGLPRKIQSISQAVSLLGIGRVAMLVNALALKTSLNAQGIERFWDQSGRTALISAWLAGRLGFDRDAAYLFGLFRDAGIPLLMRKFRDYRDTLRLANGQQMCGFTAVEDERHGVNHAIVGTILARNWNLAPGLRDAIARHHDTSLYGDAHASAEAKALVAIAHLAGQLERRSAGQDDSEWPRFQAPVMAWLMLCEEDIDDLQREASALLLDASM